MEGKYRQTSERRIQNLLGFGIGTLIKKNSMCERKAFPSIIHIKEKPKIIKFGNTSALETYLVEKFLNDIRNLKNIYSIKYSYFNKLYFSNLWRITRHFKEISSEDDKQILYKIMLLSRDSEEIIFASSNAATILNKIGFSFDDQNLQNIKIPYADLSNNSFIRTDFSNSDLRYVDFTSSFVAISNFSNCKMSEPKLAKVIFEQKDQEFIEKITTSKCGKYIAWLNSMKRSKEQCFVNILQAPQLVKKWVLPLSNYKNDISDLKFSPDSSILYILYVKEDLLIWNFCENWHKIIKLEGKIPTLGSALSDTILAYSVPDFIRIISLLTFQTLTQVKAESQSGYHIKNLNEKYLLVQKRYTRKYKIWAVDSAIKSKKITADRIIFGNDIYIKFCKGELEIVKIQSNETIWTIRDANYSYISSDNRVLVSFDGDEISIIDIQNQTFMKNHYINDNLYYYNGWLDLFKLGFLGLKQQAKVLNSSNFSNMIEAIKHETNIFEIIFKENTIIAFLSGIVKLINIETKAVKYIDIPNKDKSMSLSDDICIFIVKIWLKSEIYKLKNW